ncbi:uncharacterized protein METZ01_LOCUS258970, partial [marine metagenome]
MSEMSVRIGNHPRPADTSGEIDRPGIRVLLIYPNGRGMNMLPPAVGLLSAVLKDHGHNVELFDTTYYASVDDFGEVTDSDMKKTERLMARPYQMPEEVTLRVTSPFDDFLDQVNEFEPDLLAMSCTEDMWNLGIRLLDHVRKHREVLTIAGGVFPTFAPELVLSHDAVDIVCKGEGENALLELCERIAGGLAFDDIPNLWVKRE